MYADEHQLSHAAEMIKEVGQILNEVVQKPELKLLHITLDKQLRFATHIHNVCRKVASLHLLA